MSSLAVVSARERHHLGTHGVVPVMYAGPAMIVSPATFQRLCRARRLIEDDAEGTQTGRELALAVGLSSFHPIRHFRALFGLTPHQYRTQVRLLLGRRVGVTPSARGVAFTRPPRKAGPVTVAVFSDTCGNLIQLYQPG